MARPDRGLQSFFLLFFKLVNSQSEFLVYSKDDSHLILVPMRVYTFSDLSRTPPVYSSPTTEFGGHLQFVQPMPLSLISVCSQSLASVHLRCISLPTRFKIKWNSTNIAGAFPTLKIIIQIGTRLGRWCCAMNCTLRHTGSCFGFCWWRYLPRE